MRKFWRVAGSLKTGVILLLLLTVASLVGVVVPQGLGEERYLHQWGQVFGSLLLSVDFDHLFSSMWYRTLLFLFSFNVLLCTIVRVRASLNTFFKPRYLTAEQIGALPEHISVEKGDSTAAVAEKVTAVFKKRHFSISVSTTAATILIDARRGTLREIGSALLHFSLLPLLAGGLIAILTGFSYMQRLHPGEAAEVRNRSFKLRCESFTLERNEQGEVKDYKSGLTIISNTNETLAHKVIEVNHPLVYKGIKIYQSSYSMDPAGIDSIRLVVTGPEIGTVGKGVQLNLGEGGVIPGSNVIITAEDFIPDFMYDTKTKQVMSRSSEHNNPALFVRLFKDSDTLFSGWVFQKFGMMHHEDGTYGVSFVSYVPQQSTGLLIKENPGSSVIWFGILGMTLGVFLVFWVPRRRYWVSIQGKNQNTTQLSAGGSAIKDDPELRAQWDAIKAELAS